MPSRSKGSGSALTTTLACHPAPTSSTVGVLLKTTTSLPFFMATLHGPISISSNLQIRLPIKLARHLHLQPGDEFFARISDEDPQVITLLPVEVVERRYVAGEHSERESTERSI